MSRFVTRRSLVKGTASAAALGAASRTFGMPARISAQGSGTELILWTSFGSGPNGEAQQKLVDDYNAQGNGVTITPSLYPNYEETANAILTGLPTGDVPNVAVISDVWWFQFYLRGALYDLKEMVQEAGDYVEPLYVEYQRNDGQWAVPFARSTPLFYFNRDAVTKAGLDESIFEKWSTFKENALTLVEKGGVTASFGFGNAASYGAWTMHGPVWAFGGRYSDEDFNILLTDEGTVECGEFMRDLVQNHGAAAVTDPPVEFATGGLGAIIGSTGSLGLITESAQMEFGTAFLPEEDGFGCPTGGAGLAVIKGGKETDEHVQAAADFIAYCTSTENTSQWSQSTGYMPVRTSAVESESYKAFLADHPNNQVAINQLPKTQPQDSARVFIPNGDQILGRAWEQILVKNVPAQDAFADAQAELDEEKMPVLEALEEIEG